MASETTTETLRAAIETALRRRYPGAPPHRDVTPEIRAYPTSISTARADVVMHGPGAHFEVRVLEAGDEDDALRALALACGLRDDGSDPAEEVERLREREASHAAEMARVIAVATEGVQRTEREALDHYAATKTRMEASRDAAAQAFDDLVVRVWRAATGDAHEGPASVEVLLAAVSDLRTDNDRLDNATRGALDDLARVRGEFDAARAAAREYLAAIDEHDKARRAPAQKGSYMRLVEAQDRLDAAREALRKITEEDGR